MSITSIIGTYGLNLFCISLFTSPSLLILRDDKKEIGVFIVILTILLSFYVFGNQNHNKFNNKKSNKLDFKVRVIGSNISIDRFYNQIDPISVIKDLIEISSPPKNDKVIVVWPEGILPGVFQEQFVKYDYLFKEVLDENHLLVLGIDSKSEEKGSLKYYNSLSIYDHNLNLKNSYNKVNLVPF